MDLVGAIIATAKNKHAFLKLATWFNSSWYLDRLMIWSSSCFSLWSSKCDCDEVAAFYQCCSYLIPNILFNHRACLHAISLDTLLYCSLPYVCIYLLGRYLSYISTAQRACTSFIFITPNGAYQRLVPHYSEYQMTSHMRERTAMPILDETLMPIDGLIFTFIFMLSLVLSKL